MQKKVFSADIFICATAYIKADSAEEAAAILAGMDKGLEFRTGGYVSEGLAISGKSYDDTRLPAFSLSPSMTAYPGAVLTLEQAGKQVDPESLECVFDPLDEIEEAGYAAARAGIMWWNNPHPSGSVAASAWDKGHTRFRTKHTTEETAESVKINGVWESKPGFEAREDEE